MDKFMLDNINEDTAATEPGMLSKFFTWLGEMSGWTSGPEKRKSVAAIEGGISSGFTNMVEGLKKQFPNASEAIGGAAKGFMNVVNKNIPFGKNILMGIALIGSCMAIWKIIKAIKNKVTGNTPNNDDTNFELPPEAIMSIRLCNEIAIADYSNMVLNEDSSAAMAGNAKRLAGLFKTFSGTIDKKDPVGNSLLTFVMSSLKKLA